MSIDRWRARHYGAGYSAEYLPPGQANWRILRKNKKVAVFATARDALEAAKARYLDIHEPKIRSTVEGKPDGLAEKLQAEAEQWLKSSRKDKKDASTLIGKNRRPIIVMRGKARA